MKRLPGLLHFYSWIRKVMKCFFFLLVLVGPAANQAYATHAAGADLTYQCLGGLVYQLDYTFYRDCDGSAEPTSVTIAYKSTSCGYNRTVIAYKVPGTNGLEITFPCVPAVSTCNGGMSTGIRQWVYRAVVTLPAACTDWVFSSGVCCRNCSITTIQNPCANSAELYVEARLNNVTAPSNSSPVFNNMPIAFVCIGQNFSYNHGVYDSDGDSLAYELINPKISATGDISWLPPATMQSPMASSTPFALNPVTGDINFTPSGIQIGILAVRVNEYRDGQFIGSTIRDIQAYSMNCSNSLPVASGINGTSNYITDACAGETLCFQIHFQDSDTGQAFTYSTFNPIPGSSLIQVASSPAPILEFCWTPTPADISTHTKTFIVTINDNACPVNGVQTFSYNIFVKGPKPTSTVSPPTCDSTQNGTVTVLANSPLPCTFLWNTIPPQSTPTATGLTSGSYSVIVTDQNGCSAVQSFTLQAPNPSPQLTSTVTGMLPCQGAGNATIQTHVTGGTAPFTYHWHTGATSDTLPAFNPGVYAVTVTDANGCTAFNTALVQHAAAAPVASLAVINPVQCFGGSDGSIQLNVTGGTPPYTYLWNNGSVDSTLNQITAGIYSVTVSDANGCEGNAQIQVTEPTTPLLVLPTIMSNVLCNGGSGGMIDLVVNGGTAPYTYLWNNGITSSNPGNLPAGNYSVTVTDNNGCTAVATTAVSQPSPLDIVATKQDVSCFNGLDGVIQLAVTGGTSPYSYLWNTGATISSPSGLAAGIYSVTVTDVNGCQQLKTFEIAQPSMPLMLLPTIVSNVTCHGDQDGAINLTINGGTAPYQYLWSNGDTAANLNNLPAGNYSITVTDARGCSSVATTAISQPPSFDIVELIEMVSCSNGQDGAIQITVSGGNAPYQYLWSNGNSSSSATNLSSGLYSVTITDANGCSSIRSFEITQPSPLGINGITQPVTCYNGQDGSVNVTVQGGNAPYTYVWNSGTTMPALSGLSSGVYTVTITDGSGCTGTASYQVLEPSNPVSVNGTVQNAGCLNGNNGSVTLQVTGGTSPYHYLWNNGNTSSQISGMPLGNYMVTVTDSRGCEIMRNFVIDDLSEINLNINGSDTICVGETVTLVADSIDAANYQWYYNGNILNGATGLMFITPAAGNYYVVMNHPCGTFVSDTVKIVVKTVENVSVTNNQIVCPPETAQLFATGGSVYKWSPDAFMTFSNVPDPVVSPIQTTVYSVEIINDFGCRAVLNTTVTVMCDTLLVPTGFSPNSDGTNDGYVIDGIEQYPDNKLWVYNRWGKLVYKAKNYENNWDGTGNVAGISMGNKVGPGTYFYILDLNDNEKPRGGYLIIKH